MKRYYKIGEIAALYSVSPDSLRYYEEIGLLTPRRDANGYRMYSIEDIWRLNVIRDMLKLDFPTGQIKEYLGAHTLASTQALLQREKEAVDARIAELQAIRAGIEAREGEIAAAAARPIGKFSIKTLPERGLLRMAGEAHEDAEIDFLVKKLHKRYEDELFLIRNGATGALIPLSGIRAGIFNRYSSVFMLREGGEPCDVKIPAGEFATVCFRGAYQNTARFMPKLLAYAKAHSCVPCGNALELYLIDIHESGDPSEYITELQLPVSAAPDAAVPLRRPDSTKP